MWMNSQAIQATKPLSLSRPTAATAAPRPIIASVPLFLRKRKIYRFFLSPQVVAQLGQIGIELNEAAGADSEEVRVCHRA
jgi:hypothetical protein